MIYQGKSLTVKLNDGIAELTFDLQGESVNKLNEQTMAEIKQAVETLVSTEGVKGLLIKSDKPAFIVGADIFEFGKLAALDDQQVAAKLFDINAIFSALEDLPFPTVTAINSLTLGGGLELALATDYRIADHKARMGFPEVKLGIIPGYGGTVRAPRLIGVDNAVEWIASGKEYDAETALAVGMIDAIVSTELLIEAARDLLHHAIAGKFDFRARRQQKTSALQLDQIENMLAFETGKAVVAKQAGRHYVAPITAVKTIQKAAGLPRDEALRVENKALGKLSQMEITHNMIGLLLGDQALIKQAKSHAANAGKIDRAAVLGAGIMGGGIAYQSASTGTAIVMKDIAQQGIDAGMAEAGKLLSAQVNRGRLSPEDMASTLARITPTLNFDTIDQVDIVVEAVVEQAAVKKSVLAEVESLVGDEVILCSNTSTIPITELASALKRPENFCGMHFFNPVHRMPLVEIIRGQQTSDAAVARTVKYALAMGKKPVVVNDCPGFLVNRILFAYFAGFISLVKQGADFRAVDKAAEAFGWPMGPAYLSDVIGIDTCVHAGKVMAAGFPERMARDYKSSLEVMLDNDRLGEKNGLGFYRYEADKRGKKQPLPDEQVDGLLAPHVDSRQTFEDEVIIDRLMIPLCLEAISCLEAGIAANATELDMALIYGVGFPPFRGGAIRYVENMGLQAFCNKADQYADLGPLYQPSEHLRQLAANNDSLIN